MYDIIKARLRFGLYRHADTELEREVAGLVDEQYEDDLMRRLTGSRHTSGYVEALRLRDLAEFAAARPGQKPGERFSEWAADEVAVAMRWTRNMAFTQLHLAVTATTRLPGTLAALSRGELDLRGVKALAEITDPLDDATAKAVEDTVLPKAGKQNVSELRRAARRAVLRLDPAGAQQRHEIRKKERRVELTPLEDAMAALTATLPAPDATAIYHRLNDFAHAAPPDDTRTMDQRRADVFTDLLLGTPITPITDTTDGGASSTGADGEPNSDTDRAANTDDAAGTGATSNGGHDGSEDTDNDDQGAINDGATGSSATDDDQASSSNNDGETDSSISDGANSSGATDGSGAGCDGVANGSGAGHGGSGISRGDGTDRARSADNNGTGASGADQDVRRGAASNSGGNGGGRGHGIHGGGKLGTTKTIVLVTVPISTLMGIDDQPGDLAGYGPIPADVARDIAAGGTWKRLLTDPVSGMLLDYGRTTYRPPAALADFVRARDHHCNFPGCSHPADACDIDHRIPHPEGPTSEHNLGCMCKHHHRLKHEAGWTVEYHNGVHIWTTPDGHRYYREPHPIAQPTPQPPATPKDEPPPF